MRYRISCFVCAVVVAALAHGASAVSNVPAKRVGEVVQSYITWDQATRVVSERQGESDLYSVTASTANAKSADTDFVTDAATDKLVALVESRPELLDKLRQAANQRKLLVTDLLYGKKYAAARAATAANLADK